MITRVSARLGACLAWTAVLALRASGAVLAWRASGAVLGRRAAGATRLARDDRGATAVEYSLIIVLIAAVIAAVVGTLGLQVSSEFSKVVTGF